jgi:pyridoxamine 5'-phosphate oxidase
MGRGGAFGDNADLRFLIDYHLMTIADLRRDYRRAALSEASVSANPFEQFAKWFGEAVAAELPEPNAMTLATVANSTHGFARPSARIVLIKHFDERGFVFFTNYESRKGRELAGNPFAGLLFHWVELERQVRIEGRIEQVSAEESDAYFASRPVASRLGAWASPQSRVIQSRRWLEENLALMAARFKDDVPRPPQWGGYRVVPDGIEFWQGRPSRLHDRLLYRLQADRQWQIERLAP